MREFLTRHRAALVAGLAAACIVVAVALCGIFSPAPGGAPGAAKTDGDAAITQSGEGGAPGTGVDSVAAVDPDLSGDRPASKPALTPSGEVVPEEMIPEVTAEHERDVVLVSLAQSYSPEELTAAINASGCTVAQDITEEDLELGFVTLEVADGYDVAHAMTQLEMLPETDAAQPNFVYRIASDGADDLGASALARDLVDLSLTESSADTAGASLLAQATEIDDPMASQQWALSSINAYEAWDSVKTNKSVTVAVLDNGCLTTHEDLKDNIVAVYNAVDNSTDMTPVDNHGTHVAGIVAATANNGKGVAGVSYNAGLVPIKVFKGSNAYSSYLLTAYKYIEDNASLYNIKVVNLSLGIAQNGTSTSDIGLGGQDLAFIQAVSDAYDSGILTVCSAGNNAISKKGAYLNYPSDWLDNALGVISLQNGTPPKRSSSSNYNMEGQISKDLAAPGVGIYSTVTDSTSSYASKDGTSMASPCVAGVAALVYAAGQDLTAESVSNILCSTAQDLGAEGWDAQYGYGEVDAAAAVAAAGVFIDGVDSMLVGGTVTLEPTMDGTWTWSSSNEKVATVSTDGVVTGKEGGTSIITATNGTLKLSKAVTVFDISFTGPHAVPSGSFVELTFNENPDSGIWLIESSDSSIAYSSANADGSIAVLGVAPGSCMITATLVTNSSLVVSYPIDVEQMGLEDGSMEIAWPDLSNLVYTGSAVEPAPSSVTWTFSNGETMELAAGTDYKLSYAGDTVNVGKATVTVTGSSVCPGTVEKEYEIKPASVEVPVAAEGLVYSGKEQEGVPAGDDYALEGAASAVEAGLHEATATLTDPANHVWADDGTAGSRAISWSIARRNIEDAEVSGVEGQVLVEAGVPVTLDDLEVSIDGEALEPGRDYSVSYEGNAAIGDATVRISGEGNYEGTIERGFHIGGIALIAEAVTLDGDSFTYTGNPIEPGVTVAAGETLLTEGVDYVVSYEGNTNAGDATVTIEGTGNYVGTVAVPFSITPAAVEIPTAVEGLVYTGKKQVGVSVGAGYELTGEVSAKSVGTHRATASLTDPANHAWTDGTSDDRTVSWTIARAPISSAAISGVPAYRYYTGSALEPAITVKFGNAVLMKGLDYKVTYSSNTKVGTAKITIRGMGNFTGTVVEEFPIIAKPSCKGATSMPVRSKASWKLSNCTLKVLAGSKEIVSIKGNVVTAEKAGTAKIGVYNDAGVQVSTRTVKVYKLSGTTHALLSAVNSSYAVDVRYASKDSKANVWLYRDNGTKAQKFRFILCSDGTYTLVNPNSGKAVSVEGASKESKANVVQLISKGKTHQRWRITVDSSNRLTLVNKKSGMALHLSGGQAENGRNIYQYAVKGNASQKWILK